MYTGKTKNLGLIGWPVEYSLSPALQNAALEAAHLDYAYIAMPVKKSQLAAAVAGIRSLGFRGFNVTIPHKTAVMDYLDSIDEVAEAIGAVNTVVCQNGRLLGYNTDVIGFITALEGHGFSIKGKRAAVLGAGGAARSIIAGLAHGGIQEISIGVRNVQKAEELARMFASKIKLEIHSWEDECFQRNLSAMDLLVNTTPLGMYPNIEAGPPVKWQYIRPETFVYDVIYTPALTKFLRMARENGNHILNGEEMLVGQGAAAFSLWTGKQADTGVMLAALEKALKK